MLVKTKNYQLLYYLDNLELNYIQEKSQQLKMPVYVLRNSHDLYHFKPILKEIYDGSYMFNIVKIRHTGPPCTPRAWDTVRKTLSQFHLIYIEPQLGDPMLQYLEFLQRTLVPEDDEDDDDEDPDIRDYPDILMTCPFCGHHFDEQETLTTRGVLLPRQRPRPMGGA